MPTGGGGFGGNKKKNRSLVELWWFDPDPWFPCFPTGDDVSSCYVILMMFISGSPLCQMLEHSCSSRETMELCKLISLRVRLSCVENMDRLSFSLSWAGVTLSSSLEAVPVRVLPVIPTALARNLSSPASMAQPLHTHTNAGKRGWVNTHPFKKCYFSEWKTFKHTVELLISFKLFFWALITLKISYLDALEHYWDCKLYYNNNDNDYRLYQSDTQDYIRLVPA